jgi:hypothetical protein
MGSMQIPISVKHSPAEGSMTTEKFLFIPAKHAAIIWITSPKTDTATEWVVEGINKSVMIAHTLVSNDGKQGKIPVQVLNLTTEEMIIPINKKIVQITPTVHISALLDDKPSVTEEVDLTKQIDEAVNQTKLTNDYKQRL